MVSAATKAGKQSRWGPREEQRAVSLAGFFFLVFLPMLLLHLPHELRYKVE